MRVVRREAVPGQALVTGQAPEEGAPHMAKSMEVVPSGELQKQFGRYKAGAFVAIDERVVARDATTV